MFVLRHRRRKGKLFFIWIPPVGLCLIELYIMICIGRLNVTGKTKRLIPAKQELRRFDMISYFYLDKLRLVLFEIGQIAKTHRSAQFLAWKYLPDIYCGAVGDEAMLNISSLRGLCLGCMARSGRGLPYFCLNPDTFISMPLPFE